MEDPKEEDNSTVTRLELNNVFGGEAAVFFLPPTCKSISDDTNEIFHIIKFLSEEFPVLKQLLDNYLSIPNRKSKSLESLRSLCDEYNRWSVEAKHSSPAPKQATNIQIKFILQFIYNRAVSDPDKLNQYEPFSPQVYGETSFDLIEQLLARVKHVNEREIFVDLGSGVGNVVLHVAAATKYKRCYGFEKAEWPAYYATRMEKEFKFWMNFFGKTYSDFRLYKADFLAEDEFVEIEETEWTKFAKYEVPSRPRHITFESYVREIINDANLIFVNNYVFGAELDHQLKLRFKDMLEGALIVSSKPFCPLNFRINERNLNDIGTILNVSEFEPLSGHVSWTDKPINYYFHKVDRTLLEKYFESKKNPGSKTHRDDGKSSPNSTHSSNYSSSRCSSSPSSVNSSSCTSSSSPSSPESSNEVSSLNYNQTGSHDSNNGKSKRGRPCKDELKKSKNGSVRSVSKKKRKSSSVSSTRQKQRRHSEEANGKSSSGGRSSSKKGLSSLSSPQILNKIERNTLEKMHTATVTTTSSNTPNGDSSCFNNRSMTKLSVENLDNKRLNESRISKKIFKSMVNGNGSLGHEDDDNWDEASVRSQLGDEVVNDVDEYFKKCRKQYLKYLLYTKSTDYKNKLLLRLQNGHTVKKEMLMKKEELEAQRANLIAANLSLIKSKAAEIGLKELKEPFDLLEMAKNALSERQLVEEKLSTHKSPKLGQNRSSYTDLKRLVRVIDPTETNSASVTKRAKIEDDDAAVSKKIPSPLLPESSSFDLELAASWTKYSKPVSKSASKSVASTDQTYKDMQKQQQEQLRGFKIPKQASSNGHGQSPVNSNKTADFGGCTSTNSETGKSTSNSYYHPKKSHYMMYMMENKECSQQPNSNGEKKPQT